MLYIIIFSSIAVFCVLAWLLVYFNNSAISASYYNVRMDGAEGKKIVHISDLHGKSFGKDNIKLIKKIIEQKPDYIAVTGDIIHKYTRKNIDVALKFVSAIKEIAPVIYVSGNHEMRNKGYRFFRKQLKEAGANVLDDEFITVDGVCFTGLNGASLRNGRIFELQPDKKQILLAHEPQFFKKYISAGYPLVLCGHAHGGQWRIPFTHKGLFAPGQGRFPKYTEGVHEADGGKMIVSRGLGNSKFPLRLFNRPELVVIKLI